MYPVSDRFKVEVRYSHQAITRAEVLRDGQTIGIIYPESGSVEIDQRRAARRTCQVSLHAGGRVVTYIPTYNTYASVSALYANYTAFAASVGSYADTQLITGSTTALEDDDLVPGSGLDLLTPFGNELRLYRGIRYRQQDAFTYAASSALYATYAALGTAIGSYSALTLIPGPIGTVDEFVPLGVFPMTEVSINQDEAGVQLDITGVDRSMIVSDNRWLEPYQIASGTNVKTALTNLLQDRYPDILLRFADTTATTTAVTLGVDTENDPWADAQQIAEAAGLQLYFDADGYCVLDSIADYTVAASVEQYNENEEAMVLTTSRILSRDGIFNAVVVTAEGTDTVEPYRAVAVDDNPSSPTYVYGPFGYKPTFRSSPLINSQESANKYATSVLNEIKGTQEGLQWAQIVDPSLDAGDLVSIVNVTAKLARAIVIDRLSIPLSAADAMAAQGRTIVYQVGDTVVTAGGEAVAVVAPDTSSTGKGTGDSASPGFIIRSQSIR